MPGFTKTQLVEKALDPKRYAWCKHCRLYWSRRSFAKHRRSIQSGDIVKIDMPPMRKPKQGDVLILNPAYEKFIDALADLLVKDLLARPPAKADKKTSSRRSRRDGRQPEPEYDVLTVDQAVARLGVSRAEIMAAFDKTPGVPVEVRLM
ncbi:MAG TPA: hypothetical protein VJN18_01105 [Polyangiaceae bacterium]|nr:hypothetical protein [Polyangiaceae bacterium]